MKLSKEFIAMFRDEVKKAQWEINCWNGKSIDDLVVDYLERKELKPEDFTGAVILTVEEAKTLLFMSGIFSIDHYTPDRNKELLNNLYRQLLRQDFESTKKYFECFRKNEHFRNEWKRIEQAENKDESN
mgnify:CR=1 FL=1